MTYLRCLCAGLVLVLSACGSQPEAPVPAVKPNTPWTCIGDLDRAWHCARGRVPAVQQPERVVEQPEPEISQSGLPDEKPDLASDPAVVAAGVAAAAVTAQGTEQSVANVPQDFQFGDQGVEGQSSDSDEQAILAAPDGYYALQVVAADSAAAVAGYFEATAGDAFLNALIVRLRSRGRDWSVGIAGLYPDYASAGVAAATLPASPTPWIRRVKGLKQAILAARQP